MDLYSGTRLISVLPEVINILYEKKKLDLDINNRIFDKRLRFPIQNEYILLQSKIDSSQSAVGRVNGDYLHLVNGNLSIMGISARNLEQRILMEALLCNNIKVIFVTGRAGSGKTLLTLSAAIHELDQGNYRRLILTKPMSQVGKHPLGILPGEVDQKFSPYLDNYMDNIEHLLGGKQNSIKDFTSQYRMDFKPLQLMRGASWQGAFVILDEAQTLNFLEIATIGTRVGENCKIVIMGDMKQRDEKIDIEKTGMYKFINSAQHQQCSFSVNVHLEKIERGEIALLFADIFEV